MIFDSVEVHVRKKKNVTDQNRLCCSI